MTLEDPVFHEIQEIASLPLSCHKHELTYYPLTTSKQTNETTKSCMQNPLPCTAWQAVCVGSTCFDKINNSNCDCKCILYCGRLSFGDKGFPVDYTVSSTCIWVFLLYPCDKATLRTKRCWGTICADTNKFSHRMLLPLKYEATSLNTSSALVVVSIGLQNSISSSVEVDPT